MEINLIKKFLDEYNKLKQCMLKFEIDESYSSSDGYLFYVDILDELSLFSSDEVIYDSLSIDCINQFTDVDRIYFDSGFKCHRFIEEYKTDIVKVRQLYKKMLNKEER